MPRQSRKAAAAIPNMAPALRVVVAAGETGEAAALLGEIVGEEVGSGGVVDQITPFGVSQKKPVSGSTTEQ